MAESVYSEQKVRIEELIKSIESINVEATSFAKTKNDLKVIASNMQNISSGLIKVINTSDTILNEVQSVAVKETVKTLHDTADKFMTISNTLVETMEETQIKTENMIKTSWKNVLIMGFIAILCALISLVLSLT